MYKERHRLKKGDIRVMDISYHSPLYLTLLLGSEKTTTIWRIDSNLLNVHMKAEIVKDLQT